MMMANTVHAEVNTLTEMDKRLITASVKDVEDTVQRYVPGYRLRVPPIFDDNRITVIVQVEGVGDFLPKYSGNLDIMNCAAIAVPETLAVKLL